MTRTITRVEARASSPPALTLVDDGLAADRAPHDRLSLAFVELARRL